MLPFKNLLLTVEAHVTAHPDAKDEALATAIAQAREFLVSTKAFEYTGKLTKQYVNAAIKLVDIGQDIDDIVSALAGKKTGVEMEVYLCLVTSEKPIQQPIPQQVEPAAPEKPTNPTELVAPDVGEKPTDES